MSEQFLRSVEKASRTTDWNESKTDLQMYEEETEAKRRFEFFLPNEKNVRLLETLKGVNPAYAKHMTTRNDLLNAFAYIAGGGIDMLHQPVCGHCEAPATWGTFDPNDGKKACTCSVCGRVTRNPITVEQYLLEYVKNVDEVTLDACRPRLNDVIRLIEADEDENRKEIILK